jgi:hypothetical protein
VAGDLSAHYHVRQQLPVHNMAAVICLGCAVTHMGQVRSPQSSVVFILV